MRKPLTVLATSLISLVLFAAPASAHVSVDPESVAKGGDAKLTFLVPNEKDAASTTTIELRLPTDHPIASVSVGPQAGWSYTVEKTKLATPVKTDDGDVTEAVSAITWTGGAIKPGEFGEFAISAGPMPTDVAKLSFSVLQTYSDGEVVRWIDQSTTNGQEPGHPAPTLLLTAATGDSTDTTTAGSVDTAKHFGVAGLVTGILGMVIAILALGITVGRKPRA